jgi:diguanylate cyclase (GGDEF)-like protein
MSVSLWSRLVRPENAGRRDAATIAFLRAEIEAQQKLIRKQASALAHSHKIFDRSSAAARIGVWECSLPDERLFWTDVVYDIFELPRGSELDRGRTLEFYAPTSLEQLRIRRTRAIEERGGFELDAEIVTAKGNHRWMRITATVECERGTPVRIFGMKQDITEEKILLDRTRYLAEYDLMTGLANRSQFQAKLAEADASGEWQGGCSALLLVDLDGFKAINDTFGHAVGDECLMQAAECLKNVCRDAKLVARIGGDEFAVLAPGGLDRAEVADIARAIVAGLDRCIDRQGHALNIGASVGIAFVDAATSAELFARADAALYAAKAAGRRTFRIFKGHRPAGPQNSQAA